MGGKPPGPVSADKQRVDPGTLQRSQSDPPGVCGPETSPPKTQIVYLTPPQEIATHLKIRLVGHASPRWAGAHSNAEADKNNEVLSRKRAEQVRTAVEQAFRGALPGQDLRFEYNFEFSSARAASGAHELDTEYEGSRETLKEAGGDRDSNEAMYRRVDCYVSMTHMIDGLAPSTQDYGLARVVESTRRWAVQVAASANVHITAGGSYLYVKLKNRDTGTEAVGHVTALGGGAGAKWSPWGAAGSWSGWTNFYTDKPMSHGSFNGKGVRYTSASVSVGIGYELAYLTIYGVGDSAHSMSVGGWTWGTASAGGFVDHGNIWVNSPAARFKRVTGTAYDRYSYDKELGFGHVVNFETAKFLVSADEQRMLSQFVETVARDFRLE